MIFSVLVIITLVISICIKDRKKSLGVQATSCMLEAIYNFTISAFTAGFLSIFGMIRTFIFMNKNKFSKKAYLWILIIFESFVIFNMYRTWAGIISILPTLGTLIRTYCLWQSDMKLVRYSGITTAITYGAYYIYYQSIFMVIGELILLISGIVSMYKNDVKPYIVVKDTTNKVNEKLNYESI